MDNLQIAIIVLSFLNILLMFLVRQFDQYIYVPFLQKMSTKPVVQHEFNPSFLWLRLTAAGCGLLLISLVAWVVAGKYPLYDVF